MGFVSFVGYGVAVEVVVVAHKAKAWTRHWLSDECKPAQHERQREGGSAVEKSSCQERSQAEASKRVKQP